MCCNTKPGPAAYLQVISAVTGENVTQQDWHGIREEVEKSLNKVRLSRKRVENDEAQYALDHLVKSLERSGHYGHTGAEAMVIENEHNRAANALDGTPVTTGTVQMVEHLAKYGVEPTLQKVRGRRKAAAAFARLYPEGTVGWRSKRDTAMWSYDHFEEADVADDGTVTWKSNGSVPTEEAFDAWEAAGLVTAEQKAANAVVRKQQLDDTLAKYRVARRDRTPDAEELFEMRAAFGPDGRVVDAITGQVLDLSEKNPQFRDPS